MMRVLALGVLGLLAAGCSGDGPKASGPGSSESRRAALNAYIKTSTGFKHVAWESVLTGVEVTRVSMREDSLFVETVQTTDERGRLGMPVLYRLDAKTGQVSWSVELPESLSFEPAIVGSTVKQLAMLEKERAKLLADREVERTRKDKNVEKIQQLSDEIKRRTDLLQSTQLQDRVYCVSEHDKLHIVERPSGHEFDRVRLAFSPSTGAAASPSVVFLGALERDRLIGLDPVTWAEIIFFPASDDILTTPIYADPGNVYFASKDGHVYGYTADGRSKLIDYTTESSIVCDMCLDIESNDQGKETWGALLVGSTDYALYCFNRVTGELLWKYETGGEIRHKPQVSGGIAYCFSQNKGLHAIDKRSGKLLWIKSDLFYVICRGKDRVFYRGKGSIVALDERTGRELGRWDDGDFRWIQENTGSRMTFLVTKDGYIFAAKESEVDY